MIFKDGFEKDLTSIQLNVITVYRSLVIKVSKVPTIHGIPDEKVDLDKGYYNYVSVLIPFNK